MKVPLISVIEVYGETLVPMSLVGLFKTLAGMAFAGWIGDLVDVTPRLKFMQFAIGAEKVSISTELA